MGIAANRLSAVAVVGQYFGLVADSNLPHLDPGTEGTRQILDQFSKVDSFFGQVKKDNSLAAKKKLNVDQIHLEPPGCNQFLAGRKALLLSTGEAGLEFQVRGSRQAEDLALDRILQVGRGPLAPRAENLTELGSSVAPDHDFLSAKMVVVGQSRASTEESHSAIADDVSHFFLSDSARQPRPAAGTLSGVNYRATSDGRLAGL